MRLHWVFSTFAIGGPQRRFATLAGALGTDYEHFVTAMDGCYDAEALLPAGVWARRAPVAVHKGRFVSPANLSTFRQMLDGLRPDLLLTSNWGCIEWLLANRGHVPGIHFEDGFGPAERADRQKTARVLARRFAFRSLDALVVPSRLLEHTAQATWRMRPDRLHRIDNGVDAPRFAKAAAARTGAEGRPMVIGTVGALRPEKRLDRLVRIFAALTARHDLRLVIAGDGPERTLLEAQVARLGLTDIVTFHGAVDDPAPVLAAMDIFALTSDTEQAPIAMLEAMAAGLPVIATDVGDVRAMLSPENADMARPPEDEGGLTLFADTLVTDATARTVLGAANAARAGADFSEARMVGHYADLFTRTAARDHRSRSTQTGT